MKMTLKLALALLIMAWYKEESDLQNTPFFETRPTMTTIYNLKPDSMTQPLRYARVVTQQPFVRLKTAPSVSAPFLNITIPKNEIIEVLGMYDVRCTMYDVGRDTLSEKENGRWYRVRFDLVEGYIDVRCTM
jgi:hypothetical protein